MYMYICVYIYIYVYVGTVSLSALRGLLHAQLFSIISCCNTDIIIVRPWMLSKSYALTPWLLLWLGHGCFGLKKPGLLKILTMPIYVCIHEDDGRHGDYHVRFSV